LLFGFGVSWFFATIGLTVRNPEAAQGASFFLVFPFVFASSVFVPTATMPGWLRVFAEHQPVTILTNTVRKLSFPDAPVSGGDSAELLVFKSLLWIVALIAVFGYLSVRQYKKVVA
jgi:ABC-2 type transport system permease protein